ncbi:Uncharacterized protein BP5553_08033 [Venustampulla echinocandica]|uniref:Meiotically up-regulated gene 154 protein n=1 Tax=Venustampulla echinocandica TaxID=2656787 RepID=A0A370TFJ0_9HELO|nr:Uncharacterized protein BP5553_08033 [Venustampulla echinocandica]RDL33665.1 Uncharacterized protein BP5553_08033 [Venustampulla echinocandica]
MPRLIRRKPAIERIKDFLNPGDFLLWLSEEIETRDWDSKQLAHPVALGLHVVFLIARANSGTSANSGADDVFGDEYSRSGWFTYTATFLVYVLTSLSIANAVYTFNRKRHYRLFESAIETPQKTPSAHRVRVDSSPVASSPLRFLTSILGDPSAESRAHPDPTRDVWEIAVWDPIPVCLRLFCLFSPGHVLVYWLFLPTQLSDPRPSITVFTTILLQALISSQLVLVQTAFSQQEKDSAIIHQEVLSEYNIKYVHPRLNPVTREVGTQFNGPASETGREAEGTVETYTPTVIINRGFHTQPNPNYAKHVNPKNPETVTRSGFSPTPSFATPRPPVRQPQFRQSMSTAVSTGTSTGGGGGGSLGVFNHANSPLKKATSLYDLQRGPRESPRNSFSMARREIQEERERSRSPVKRKSEIHTSHHRGVEDDRRISAPGGFGSKPQSGGYVSPYKRMPSRF